MADPVTPRESPFGPVQGPFSSILQSGLVPGTQEHNERPSGFMGNTGKLAFLGTKILEGFQRGKLLGYMAEEQKRESQFRQGLALSEAAVQEATTPEAREAAIKTRDQWLLQHMNTAFGDEGKGKTTGGKKTQKSPDEYPSKGGKVIDRAQAGIGDQVKGIFGTIVKNLGGPNLPHTGVMDVNALKSQLFDIRNMPTGDQKASEVSSQAAGLVQQVRANKGTAEDLVNDPGYFHIMDQAHRYMTPQQAKDLQQSMTSGLPTVEQRQAQTLSEQKIKMNEYALADEKIAQEAASGLDKIASGMGAAPPPDRGGFTPIAGASHAGPPEAQPIPEAQKTPQQQIAEQFRPSETSGFFGSEVRIPPQYADKYGKPSVVFYQKGNEALALYRVPTRSGQTLLMGADGRLFDYRKAEAAGWTPQASRPTRISSPRPDWRTYTDDGKNYYYVKVDHETGALSPVTDPRDPSKRLKARVTKDAADHTLQSLRIVNQVVSTRNSALKQLEMRYQQDLADIKARAGKYSATVTPQNMPQALKAREDAYNAAKTLITNQSEEQLKMLRESLGQMNLMTRIDGQETDIPEMDIQEETPAGGETTLENFVMGGAPPPPKKK